MHALRGFVAAVFISSSLAAAAPPAAKPASTSAAKAAPPAAVAPAAKPAVAIKEITKADVEKTLKGTFEDPSAPMSGMNVFKEKGGVRRVTVQVAPSKGEPAELAKLKADLVTRGRQIEDVPGIGDGALFTTTKGGAQITSYRKGKPALISVAIEGSADLATARAQTAELVKLALSRL